VRVSFFASQHRATRPRAGMVRIGWMFAPLGVYLHTISITKISSVPSIEQALSLFGLFGSGCVACHGKPSFKGEELR
jgi:hypothetical protein